MTVRPVTALVLAANPVGTSRLQLDEEMRAILTKVRASDHRDAIAFVQWHAARPDDLMQTLLQYRPDIVHFSGHGSAAGELILTGDDGGERPVPAEALRRIFRVLRDNVRLVLLNACWSAPQAEAIAESVDFTIGMRRPIGDRAAITFAASFYRALGFGRSVREAFELGTTAVLLEGIPEDATPRLITRPGAVEPAYLVTAARSVADRPAVIVSGFADPDGPRSPSYTSRSDGGRTVIEPADRYLDQVRNGGRLEDRSWEHRFAWPALDIKVVNNTDRTVVLHEAVLHVRESRTDPRPVPTAREEVEGMHLWLSNAGWGDMTGCVLRFRLAPADGGPAHEFTSRFDDLAQGNDLRAFFAEAGVDVGTWEALRRGRAADHGYGLRGDDWVNLPEDGGLGEPIELDGGISGWYPARRIRYSAFRELLDRALGPFRCGKAVLTGELTYRCLDRDGRPVEQRNRVVTTFDLAIDLFEPGSGAALPPSSAYRSRLRADGRDYQVPVPISQSLTPGEADRFLIRVAAERSSLHALTLTLRYNEGEEVTSAPVALDLFVSRFEVEQHLWNEAD